MVLGDIVFPHSRLAPLRNLRHTRSGRTSTKRLLARKSPRRTARRHALFARYQSALHSVRSPLRTRTRRPRPAQASYFDPYLCVHSSIVCISDDAQHLLLLMYTILARSSLTNMYMHILRLSSSRLVNHEAITHVSGKFVPISADEPTRASQARPGHSAACSCPPSASFCLHLIELITEALLLTHLTT